MVQGLKNLPANAEDTGSIPDPGRCQRPWSNEAREPPLLSPRAREPTLCNKRNHGSEKPGRALQLGSSPPSKDPAQPREEINIVFFKEISQRTVAYCAECVLENSSTMFGWRGRGGREPSSGGSCGKAFILYLLPPSWYPRRMATSEVLRPSQAPPFWPLPGMFSQGLDLAAPRLRLSLSVCACMFSVSASLRPRAPQPIRLLRPWGYPGNRYWTELPFPPPGGLPKAGTEPSLLRLLHWQVDLHLPLSHLGGLSSDVNGRHTSVTAPPAGGCCTVHCGRELLFRGIMQFSSVAQSCPTLCDPMDRSTPGFPVHHQLRELVQTHAHRVGDAIQPSHPLSSPSPPAPNPSQHQGLSQ